MTRSWTGPGGGRGADCPQVPLSDPNNKLSKVQPSKPGIHSSCTLQHKAPLPLDQKTATL